MKGKYFNTIKVDKPKSSFIDLSHDVKMSGGFGMLMPCLAMDVVPGDRVSLGANILVRFQPMLAPIMHRVDAYVHYFFVPNRILWPNWQKYITGAYLNPPGSETAPVSPYIPWNTFTAGTPDGRLADYIGVPPWVPGSTNHNINLLPFSAYKKICADYYLDQNYEVGLFNGDPYPGTVLQDGNNFALGIDWGLEYRAWEHDRFTSVLPWAQKGPVVLIPFTGQDVAVHNNSNGVNLLLTSTPLANANLDQVASENPDLTPNFLYADTSELQNENSINELRKAYSLQRWLEKNARGGTRYDESILMHFGVRTSDARLQRSEYITGLKAPIIVSEVLNTSGTATEPQGNMAGHGVSYTGGGLKSYFCEEHGWIIGIVSVLPKTGYQQGIDKKFMRPDPLDYFWKDFEQLGEQPLTLKEIYAQATDPEEVFGYEPRYAEYKYQYNRVAGDFRTTLDFWHLSRIFSADPVMGETFIKCNPTDANRVFAVTGDGDKILMHIENIVKARRPMSNYGTPV